MIINGNALSIPLASNSVHCVVTSPPYWGLRDYGTATWEGGDEGCNHTISRNDADNKAVFSERVNRGERNRCIKCGAVRIDNQLGLEATPEEYVANMVAVFREVWRVLRDDGTCWVNLGDSYASQTKGSGGPTPKQVSNAGSFYNVRHLDHGLKEKDLVGIPWRVAFALQQPFYTGRIKREIDRVWMAATLDAEGTICGFRHERPDGNIRTGILVFITNSDTRLLDRADEIWPGARYIDHNFAGQETTKAVFATRDSWRWQIQKAEERSSFIQEIYPYLVSKKEQALIAWNMLQFAIDAKHMGRNGETKDVKEKRELLASYLSELNHGKKIDIPSWLKEPPTLFTQGWFLRSDIIWSKSNPMPESVTDRPTKAHEYLFLLAKRGRYYYDADAVREDGSPETAARLLRGVGANHKNIHGAPGQTAHSMNQPRNHGDGYDMPAGRNRRTVWTIPTAPYKGAHFATFPPALVEPCIKAGTSERGVCPKCGKPWVRVVERINESTWQKRKELGATGGAMNEGPRQQVGVVRTGELQSLPTRENITTGWQPSCSCSEGISHDWSLAGGSVCLNCKREKSATIAQELPCGYEPIPALVFDPFAGSGTTVKVAYDLGRKGVGLDLSLEYLDAQARGRIHNGHTGRLL